MDSSVRRRLIVVLLMVLLGFAGLGFRLYKLMIISGDKYSTFRDRNYQAACVLPAQRGRILDRHLQPLATDRAAWSLYVTDSIQDPGGFAKKASQALGLTQEDGQVLLQRISSKPEQVKVRRLARGITGEKYDTLVKALESYSKEKTARQGWFLDPEFPRFYPEGSLAANVVGYVGADQEGQGGIEYEYEERLKGVRERVIVEVDARRRIMADNDYTKEASVRGADLILTIDSRIQLLVEQELRAVLDRTGAIQAMAVVLDPKNGEVLSMAVVPGFDPNRFHEVGEVYRKCRPITDMFEPGSVVKPFIVAGALENRVITPGRVFFCEKGRYVVRGRDGKILRTLRDDVHRFGDLTARDILVRSSNIGMCKIAAEMGEDALYSILTRFGFGSVSGVDLPGETPGVLRPVRAWSALSMYALPFGQELATNALVVATAYATLANRGLRIQPHVVKGYRNPTNGMVSFREIPHGQRIIDSGIAETVIDMLIGVAEDPNGTGYSYCRIPGSRVAGKTGTAQKAGPSGTYEQGKRIVSWAGFFPAEDPEVVIYVVVDEPKKGKYGGEVAGGAFANIAKGLISYWGLIPEPTYPEPSSLIAESPASAGSASASAAAVKVTEQTPVPGVMPNLTGMSIREAYLTLIQSGFRASFDGKGWVVGQETVSGQTPLSSHAGRVMLSTGPDSFSLSGVVASAPLRSAPAAASGK